MDRLRFRNIPLRGQRMRGDELIEKALNKIQQYIPLKINEQREPASNNVQMPKQSVYLFSANDALERQDSMLYLIARANDTGIPLTMGNAMSIFSNLFLMASGQPKESLIQILSVNFNIVLDLDIADW